MRMPFSRGHQREEIGLPAGKLRLLTSSATQERASVLIIGAILAVTVVGLTYTTQLLAAAGDRYQIDRLLMEREGLLRTLRSQAGTIARIGSESEIERWAFQDGLDRVGDSIRIEVR